MEVCPSCGRLRKNFFKKDKLKLCIFCIKGYGGITYEAKITEEDKNSIRKSAKLNSNS